MKKMKLKDICDVLNGYAFKSEKYVDSGLRIIRITNVQKGYIEDEKPQFYPIDEKDELADYLLNEEDILMSLTGNVGRVALLDPKWLPAVLNQRVACLRMKTDKVLKKYLYYSLLFDGFERECIHSAKGIAQKNMSTEWLKNYEISVCSLDEQRKIINILDNLVNVLDGRQEELDKLDELVKARFVEMFGNIESNDMNWNQDSLKNHLKVIGGYAFKSTEYKESGIPVLRIGNINAGFFRNKELMFYDEKDSLKQYEIYPNDIVMSLTGTVGKDDYGNVCIMGYDYNKYYLNQRNAKLELKPSLNVRYIENALKIPDIKKRLTGISRGVRQANIANRDIENLIIPIPPIDLQNEFADFVKQIDKLKFDKNKYNINRRDKYVYKF